MRKALTIGMIIATLSMGTVVAQDRDAIVIRVGEYPDKPGKRVELSLGEDYGRNYPLTENRELGEYYINKQIAISIADQIRAKDPNIKVVVQYTESKAQDLNAAGRIAKGSGAKIYLSVHTNASPDKNASGGYFITGKKATWGDNNLAERLRVRLGFDRPNALNVDYIGELNEVDDLDTIAVLAEYGFFTNEGDRKKLTDEDYIKKISEMTAEEMIYTLEILNRTK